MNKITNLVEVVGKLQNGLSFSHESVGEKLYEGTIIVKRLSGTEDHLPVIVPSRLLEQTLSVETGYIRITGQLRSHNKEISGKNRLLVSLFAQNVDEAEGGTQNSAQLTGAICRAPSHRFTPYGREICDVMLAVDRGYGKTDYIPIITWGDTAARTAALKVGDHISVIGRFQSRAYEKRLDVGGSVTRMAYEVSVSKMGTEGAA